MHASADLAKATKRATRSAVLEFELASALALRVLILQSWFWGLSFLHAVLGPDLALRQFKVLFSVAIIHHVFTHLISIIKSLYSHRTSVLL
jgi:hypothetical protein